VKEKQYNEAIIEYKNVLQIDPNHAPAHYGLAKAYLQSNKLREGYWELRETARLDPNNLDARQEYGQLARMAGEREEALAQADAVIAADPTRYRAHLLRGQVLEQLKRPEEAKASYEKAVEVGQGESAPLLVLADYLERNGDRAAAEPYLKQLVETKPGFTSSVAYGGFLARDPKRAAEAEAVYKSGLDQATPDERSVAVRTLASFYYSQNRFDECEATLRQGLEQTPDDLELIYSLARFYAARGDKAKADQMVEQATQAKPGDVQPYLVLSAYRSQRGDSAGALAAAEDALKIKPDDQRAKLRKAELLLDIGYREGAKEKIAEGRGIADAVLATDPNSAEAMFVKAKIDLAENRPDAAATGLRRAIEIRPDWPQAHLLLGSALFVSGDRNGARSEVSRALELDAGLTDARKLLARIQASLGADDIAVEEGRKALSESDDPAMHIIVAQSLVRLGKVDDAYAELQKIPEADRSAEAWYAMGRVDLLKRRLVDARQNLERSDSLSPHNPEILDSLLMLDRIEGKTADSLTRIQRAAEAEPQNAKLAQLLGVAYANNNQVAEAEQQFRHAAEIDPNDIGSYQALAQLLLATGRKDESIQTYEKAIAQRPDSAQLYLVLGTLLEASGDNDGAIKRYSEAVKLDDNLAVAKNNLAYLLADRGRDLDQALELAQAAKAAMPENANVADTLGWVLFKKGAPSAAIGYLREAEGSSQPGDPTVDVVRWHLAQAYEANGETDRARETIARAVQGLDDLKKRQTDPAAGEPSWAAGIRAMAERLGPATASPSEPAPRSGQG
jgi:tetratricopeptide (TPR) repeat protein